MWYPCFIRTFNVNDDVITMRISFHKFKKLFNLMDVATVVLFDQNQTKLHA